MNKELQMKFYKDYVLPVMEELKQEFEKRGVEGIKIKDNYLQMDNRNILFYSVINGIVDFRWGYTRKKLQHVVDIEHNCFKPMWDLQKAKQKIVDKYEWLDFINMNNKTNVGIYGEKLNGCLIGDSGNYFSTNQKGIEYPETYLTHKTILTQENWSEFERVIAEIDKQLQDWTLEECVEYLNENCEYEFEKYGVRTVENIEGYKRYLVEDDCAIYKRGWFRDNIKGFYSCKTRKEACMLVAKAFPKKPTKEMTVAEIEEQLGYKVKVVK